MMNKTLQNIYLKVGRDGVDDPAGAGAGAFVGDILYLCLAEPWIGWVFKLFLEERNSSEINGWMMGHGCDCC